MTTTPPPPLSVPEPPAPLYGPLYDNRRAPPVRKSTRFANQHRSAARTPSPPPEDPPLPVNISSTPQRQKKPSRPAAVAFSPPSSNPTSPQHTGPKRTRGANGASTSATNGNHLEAISTLPAAVPSAPAMLPTPAKTPRKKDAKPDLSTARVLFPGNRPDSVDDAMPRSRRGPRSAKWKRLSLGSDDGNIEIFTDSKERIPEIDESADNPFYVKPGSQRAHTVGKKNSELKSKVDRALEKDEGMVYVFRGKKIYKKFHEDDEDDDQLPDGVDSTADLPSFDNLPTPRRFTRSSIKPKLLFPSNNVQNQSAEQLLSPSAQKGNTTDEEAVTDIEDPAAHGENRARASTPQKNIFPVSPPTTLRATRSSTKRQATSSPIEPAIEPPRFGARRSIVTNGDINENPKPRQAEDSHSNSSHRGKKRDADTTTSGSRGKRMKM